MRTIAKNEMSYPGTEIWVSQFRLLGGSPYYPVKTEGSPKMSESFFSFFGPRLGGLSGVGCLCGLQITRFSERREEDIAKRNCADTFPSD
jgi:hypothetical protein